MPKGDKILASEYNGWWTTLNTIRTKWDAPGSSITGPTVTAGATKATATDMNSLINQVNALATFYSGADWTNFTESTKTPGQLIQYPDKMVYMLNYLNGVCNFCSTFGNDSFDGFDGFDSFRSTFGNNSTDGTDGFCSTNSVNNTQTTQSTQSTDGTQSTDSVQSTNSRFSTNHTEGGGQSKRFGDSNAQTNNGTCSGFTGF